MKKTKVAIIGGGASGLVASIVSARNGCEVTIYEKSNRVGKKILATGNGRCNYTNIYMDINKFHSNNINLVRQVIEKFSSQDVMDFFEDIGVYPCISENGKVFPYSLQSSSVLDNLRFEANRLGVKEITECNINSLRKCKGQFDIITDNKNYSADKLIICTGGKAGLQYGCLGDGYKYANNFKHKVTNIFPALVQLKLSEKFLKRISGVRFDSAVKILSDNKMLRQEEGEVLFTDYGISGPAVLQVSRYAVESIISNKHTQIIIDLLPKLSKYQLYDILKQRFIKLKDRCLVDTFNGLIHKKLISLILEIALKEYKSVKCTKLNKKEIYSIINVIKEFKLEVSGYKDWKQAQTTAGGVSLDNIDMNTFESKIVKGLYFAGEVLDVDGDCGGYNLQFAWSSGYISGYNSSIVK